MKHLHLEVSRVSDLGKRYNVNVNVYVNVTVTQHHHSRMFNFRQQHDIKKLFMLDGVPKRSPPRISERCLSESVYKLEKTCSCLPNQISRKWDYQSVPDGGFLLLREHDSTRVHGCFELKILKNLKEANREELE